jgi:hypothetical protein
VPRSFSWLSLTVVLSCAACGSPGARDPNQKPTFPARGKVFLDDEPLRNAIVTLHPLEAGANAIRSYAKSGPDGSFELSTYQPGDGVPAGRYAVTILHDADENGVRVPGRYGNPKTSGLIVEVKDEENTLPSFRLRRK